MSILQKIGAQFKDVRVIDPIDLFCTTSECRPNTGKTMLFSDTNHLSPAGIEIFYEKYRRCLYGAKSSLIPSAAIPTALDR